MMDNDLFQLHISYFNFEKKFQQQIEIYFCENIRLIKKSIRLNAIAKTAEICDIHVHIYFFTELAHINTQMLERSKAVNARILFVGQFDEFENFLLCVQTGAYGCIPAINMSEEITPAILSVLQNKIYVSPGFAAVINTYFKGNKDHYSSLLTSRENKLIQLLTKGALYKEIAWHLRISENTVRSHVRNIYSKLKVHSKTELTRKILGATTLNVPLFNLLSDYVACLCY
ncbi:MAG: response regulator transcription factor [Parafilimonas sp.]